MGPGNRISQRIRPAADKRAIQKVHIASGRAQHARKRRGNQRAGEAFRKRRRAGFQISEAGS